eukprot:CAMPEP_0196720654 /NCGR_PEP_ID=MMETSP1091-20130531/3404_1 /TAXON_ID=302021 /ORGANISM="Rhodomonas sp., Strain CCMP768" /LENGTH=114 /DNA_ID=CAMNT_0042061955 /DNA_START=93 /DNA_END=437 /DNA_ORIENTATION=+
MKWLTLSVPTNFEESTPPQPLLRSPGSTLRHYPNVADTRSQPVAPSSDGNGRTAPIGIPSRNNRNWINQGSFSDSLFGRSKSSPPEDQLSQSASARLQTPAQLFSMISNLDRNG